MGIFQYKISMQTLNKSHRSNRKNNSALHAKSQLICSTYWLLLSAYSARSPYLARSSTLRAKKKKSKLRAGVFASRYPSQPVHHFYRELFSFKKNRYCKVCACTTGRNPTGIQNPCGRQKNVRTQA